MLIVASLPGRLTEARIAKARAWPARAAGALVASAMACTACGALSGRRAPAFTASSAARLPQERLLATAPRGTAGPEGRVGGCAAVEEAVAGEAAAQLGSGGLAVLGAAALALRAKVRTARRQPRSGLSHGRTARPCAANGGSSEGLGAGATAEAERMFREAYEAEAERAQLLKQQLETALMAKLQADGGEGSGMRITVESNAAPLSPEEPGGRSTWREAYEAVKARAASLEEKLKKASGMGTAAAVPPPPAAPAATVAAPAEPVAADPKPAAGSGFNASPFDFIDADERDPQGFQKLEDLAQNTIEDEAAVRLIAVPILGRRRDGDRAAVLPPAGSVREILGSDQFSIAETVEFGRVYVLKGTVAKGVAPGNALEELRNRLADRGYGESTEVFLQKSMKENESVLFLMLKEDLPQNEFAWWQWVLCVVLLLATIGSVNITTFSVVTVSQMQMSALDLDTVVKIAGKTVPTAVAIFATVAAQEVARRVAAAKYDVELTPPFFIPVWPFPSVGCLGAISRRLGTVPNEEASVVMSVAAGLAGYAVSFAVLLYGLSMGPDADKLVNLNFQLLPLVLKLALKPLLGPSSVSDQPDPFADPISIAFPANALTIGGIIGLIVVSLNLLPIGRLDGGTLVKSIVGGRTGSLLGFGGLGLLLLGSLAPNDAGLIYITFAFFALVFQSGSESPPRDSVTDLDGSLKFLGLSLVVLGSILAVPGAVLPNI
mmetsp:Transcript_36562/g.101471  ORF Transcript_36562/g.101471 Transcript_36562/m.101471 type:complete len:721 (-) Transcript_36562:140-2302(-)